MTSASSTWPIAAYGMPYAMASSPVITAGIMRRRPWNSINPCATSVLYMMRWEKPRMIKETIIPIIFHINGVPVTLMDMGVGIDPILPDDLNPPVKWFHATGDEFIDACGEIYYLMKADSVPRSLSEGFYERLKHIENKRVEHDGEAGCICQDDVPLDPDCPVYYHVSVSIPLSALGGCR